MEWEDLGFYKHLVIIAFEEENMDAIAIGEIDRSKLHTEKDRKTYDKMQIKLKRRILSSLSADLSPRVYGIKWVLKCGHTS
ncbi:hypothetical protein CCR75_003939 [Bremia lactucae]|uniref:Uncharacterized protein n=1 Tax=Bremia lactucae TaxID=4779 RepID=A0A976FM99_BRELC|nr:hypothetical protein CCR75_003939 [Bremia lactucae]